MPCLGSEGHCTASSPQAVGTLFIRAVTELAGPRGALLRWTQVTCSQVSWDNPAMLVSGASDSLVTVGKAEQSVHGGFFPRVELAKQRPVQLCPGVIIHCSMVNRCHEAQELAKDMKPKFPSFAGFPINFLMNFAS